MAHLVRCVELGEDHSVGCSLTEVAHPEFGSLKVWRVDHKLLQSGKLLFLVSLLRCYVTKYNSNSIVRDLTVGMYFCFLIIAFST